MLKNYYSILDLETGASEKEVRKAYFTLVKNCHPDRVAGAEEKSKAQKKFVEITQAYQVLCDSKRRIEYDRLYAEQSKSGVGASARDTNALEENKPKGENEKKPSRHLRQYEKSELYFDECRKLLASGAYKEAIKLLLEAIGKFPSDGLLYRTLAICYLRDRRLKLADKACNRAIIYEPENYLNYLTMGTVLETSHNLVDAREYYEKASKYCADAGIKDKNVELALNRVSQKFRLITHQRVSWPLIAITFIALAAFIYVMTISMTV